MLRYLFPIVLCLLCRVATAQSVTILEAATFIDGLNQEEKNPDIRWIWLNHAYVDEKNNLNPEGEEQRLAVLTVVNSVLSHSSVVYKAVPVVSEDRRIVAIPVDFAFLAGTSPEWFKYLLYTWDQMGHIDPYGHAKLVVEERIDVNNGRGSVKSKTVTVPAPHLGEVGISLEKFVGCRFENGHWHSVGLPFVRADFFIVKATSSIGDGQYLKFRGLKVGHTKFGDYLKSRGAPLNVAKNREADERAGLMSHVTGDARVVTMYQGQGTRLTQAVSIVMFTEDLAEDNRDPNSDPILSLLNPKVDAIEAFVTLPNGSIEMTLWNVPDSGVIEDAVLLAEAPPDVVSDHRIPEPHRKRLNGFISCARCHADQDMFIGFRNEVRDYLSQFGTIQTDVSEGVSAKEQFEATQKILYKYSAKQEAIDSLLKTAREGWDKFCIEATGTNQPRPGKLCCDSIANVFKRYEYEWVNAKTARDELGIAPVDNDPLGVEAYRKTVLAGGDWRHRLPTGSTAYLVRLGTTYKDFSRNEQGELELVEKSLSITRRQWEQGFAEAALSTQN